MTASFDDKNHIFSIRLATPSVSNTSFPATDSSFRANIEKCNTTFKHSDPEIELPIDDVSLLRLISSSPVASVQFFRTLFEAFLYILVGIPPPEQQNEVPINHPSRKGIWGIITDISIVHETNGRHVYIFYLNGIFFSSLMSLVLQRLPSFSHTIDWCNISLHATNGSACSHVQKSSRKGLQLYDFS